MILSGDWKMRVRTMRSNGDNEGAKRELRKAKMIWYDKLEEDSDKIFIDYCLAHYCFKENDFEMVNRYLDMINTIFEDKYNIDCMKKEYCNFLWLNVNVNYEKMKSKDIVNDMYVAYKYYMSINEKDIAISALINVFVFTEKEEKILSSLRELLQCNISDWNFVESILVNCEKINHSLYIKALELVNKYKININLQIV